MYYYDLIAEYNRLGALPETPERNARLDAIRKTLEKEWPNNIGHIVDEPNPGQPIAGAGAAGAPSGGGWMSRIKAKMGFSSKIDSATRKNLKAQGMKDLAETVESTPNAVLSKRVENAVNGKPLITDLGSNVSLKDISKYVANGEVCSIGSGKNQKLYVNDNGNPVEIKLSKEKFEELFPQIGTATFSQAGGTQTCTIMANLNAMLDTPSGRAKLYTMFEQNGNSITINLRGNKEPVTFPDGKPLNINLRDHNANLFYGDAQGIEMLQQAVLIDRIRVADNVAGVNVTDFSLQRIIKAGRTMAGNDTAAIPLLGKSGKTALFPKQIKQMIENEFKPGKDIMTAIIGGQQGHDISIVDYDAATGTVTYHDPMHAGYNEQISLDDFLKQTTGVFLHKADITPAAPTSVRTQTPAYTARPSQNNSTSSTLTTAADRFKSKTTTITNSWKDIAYTAEGTPVRAMINNGAVAIEKNGRVVQTIKFDEIANGISIRESSTGNFLNIKADEYGRISVTTDNTPEFQPNSNTANTANTSVNTRTNTDIPPIPKGFKPYQGSSKTLISTDGNSIVLRERNGKWYEVTNRGTLVEYKG